LAGMLSLLVGYLAAIFSKGAYDFRGLVIGFAFSAVGMWVSTNLMKPSRLQKRTAALLIGITDLRALGPLVDMLGSPLTAATVKVTSPIRTLLLRLRASDVGLIEERHRNHFRYVLKHWNLYQRAPAFGTNYVLAVLAALEQVGDARDLPMVERIAYLEHPSRHTADSSRHRMRKGYNIFQPIMGRSEMRALDKARIVEAALECLPYLQEKAEKHQVSTSLLRASAPATDTSGILLRPATGHRSMEAQSLLRATSGGVEHVQ